MATLLCMPVAGTRHTMALTGTQALYIFGISTDVVAELVYQNAQSRAPSRIASLLQLTMSSHDHCTLLSIRTQKSEEQGPGSTAKNIRAFNMSTGASLLVQTQFT